VSIKRSAFCTMADEPLILRVPENSLDCVKGQSESGNQPVLHVRDTTGTDLPEDPEDSKIALAGCNMSRQDCHLTHLHRDNAFKGHS
jgi:hypothetical protein